MIIDNKSDENYKIKKTFNESTLAIYSCLLFFCEFICKIYFLGFIYIHLDGYMYWYVSVMIAFSFLLTIYFKNKNDEFGFTELFFVFILYGLSLLFYVRIERIYIPKGFSNLFLS